MSLSADFLEIVRCPACKARVALKTDNNSQSSLKCESCHRVYPIRDEIPIMLIDEATIEEGSTD